MLKMVLEKQELIVMKRTNSHRIKPNGGLVFTPKVPQT
jgi:hypothetical protein